MNAEQDLSPVRFATYCGDRTGDVDRGTWLGPDRRGIIWRTTHAEYDADTDTTRVVFRPVADYELDQVPGLRDRLELMQQKQAEVMGAKAAITGREGMYG